MTAVLDQAARGWPSVNRRLQAHHGKHAFFNGWGGASNFPKAAASLDLWEKHQLEKQLPLEHYQLRENSVRNKQDENVIRVYAPPNLSTKWATRSIPSIEIAKLHDSGRVVIRIYWPVHTRQKWLKINNSHLPQSKKSIDDPALAQKFRDFFQ